MENKYIIKASEIINKAGYKVFTFTDDDVGFAHFSDGDRVVYFQTSKGGTIMFASEFKPTKDGGTGYKIDTVFIDNLTAEKIKSIYNHQIPARYKNKKMLAFEEWKERQERYPFYKVKELLI